jgi:quinol-cytochrome oxidoreductase complex cytochrome b subunit
MVRGGMEVNASTLLIFYNFHTGILPFLIVILMIYHFWKVRKAKGVAIPEPNQTIEKVNAYPDLVRKELVVALSFIAIIMLLSVIFNAPLQERANPAFSPNPAKAPWYFMGVQELLLHIHPFFAVVVIPVLFFGTLIYLPYAKVENIKSGHWFYSEKGKQLAIQSAIIALIITPLIIILDQYFLAFANAFSGVPLIISEGLLPFLLLIITFGIYLFFMIKKQSASYHEVIVSLFTIIIVSYIILTIIGIWFRGPGMVLTWPG